MILACLSCISRNIWTFLFGFPILFLWGGRGFKSPPLPFLWNKRPWRVAACRNVWRIYASWVFVDLSHERPAGLDQCTVAFQRWRDQCTARWKIPTIWRCKFPIKKWWVSNVFHCIVCLLEGNVIFFYVMTWWPDFWGKCGRPIWHNMSKLMNEVAEGEIPG